MAVRALGKKVLKAIKNPRLACREVNKLTHQHVPFQRYEKSSTVFIDEDWDNLLILDACRFDLFEAENTIDGRLERRRSGASSTVEFLYRNVDGRDLTDTVYVTANGQVQNFSDKLDINFYDVVPLYADGWDKDLKTVPPEVVTEEAIEAERTYPNKRLLVHYVQPHFPFIGSDTEADKYRTDESTHDTAFWQRVLCGQTDLTRADLWDAYRETLRVTLPHVERIVSELDGKTVVTSDHGNLFGERSEPIPIREWGHPTGLYHEKLVEVPWLVCEGENRKRVAPEPAEDRSLKPDPAVVEDRLEDLGYK